MVVGRILRISGPLVVAEGMSGSMVYEVVYVGNERLIGEIIGLRGDKAFIQVYEDTSGLEVGEPVEGSGSLLFAELGPGIVGKVFDGLQRPLSVIGEVSGPFVRRGVKIPALPRDVRWEFIRLDSVKPGDKVGPGDVLGVVKETPLIDHYIMIPPNVRGVLKEVVEGGKYTVTEPVAWVDVGGGRTVEVTLMQKWPVRKPRPYVRRLEPTEPLITGQRVLDMLFPIARGGKAAVPGGFGSGKCVPPETPVLLANGELIPIDELYRRSRGVRIDLGGGEEVVWLEEPVEVIGFDGEGFRVVKATHIYKGYSDLLAVIKTSSGRIVKVTPRHRLPVINGDGSVTYVEAWRLRPGMALAVPREVKELRSGLRESLSIDEAEAELLGILAAGSVIRGGAIVFNECRPELKLRINELIRELGVNAVVEDGGSGLRIKDYRGVLKWIASLALKPSAILKYLMGSPANIIASFIKGVHACCGRVVDGVINLSVKSRELMTCLTYMLMRLGIEYKVVRGDGMHSLIITGLDAESFRELILDSSVHEPINNVVEPLLTDGCCIKDLSSSSLIPDVVESVELVSYNDVVYDLVVEGTHNFIGGYVPVIYHNTVLLQTLTKWARTKLNIYVGCGERGNEMADALHSFLRLKDPASGRPLAEKAVFIANTSNMPVAARETSVFLGVTIGEYFRDMGYDVLLVADSTSRWAEAMREISARLEEMPGEEGFPAYLGSRLAEFYERSGRVECLGRGGRVGSLTIVGAVSPPGADFSEPVTQNTLRYIGTLIALDVALANRRHFPAVSWLLSYSLYVETVERWWRNSFPNWRRLRDEALGILQREAELMEIVRLVGPDALPDNDKLLLDAARMIREDFLQQNAFHPIDSYCPPEKTVLMLDAILTFYSEALRALDSGVPLERIRSLPVKSRIARMKEVPYDEFRGAYESIVKEIKDSVSSLIREVGTHG